VNLNPALRSSIWDGRRYVPKGYKLRLPAESRNWTPVLLAQQLDPKEQYVNQPRARSHRVRSGDTLATVARKHGLSISIVAKLNGLKESDALKVRATLRLPDVPATRVAQAKSDAPEPVAAGQFASVAGIALQPGDQFLYPASRAGNLDPEDRGVANRLR
jgi:membrane-bound lytic murein transglycosylase D